MRMTQLFGRTLREAPTDADNTSYRLMARAGLIKKLSAGIFTYGPLFWRVMRKAENIIREEMDAIGGQEINMPVVQPAELWNETGRYGSIGSELVRFKDRAGRNMVLAMTHEEVVTDLVRRETISYRQLPFMLYQVQTKFRDEPRARGGLIRVREFVMKDAYSFHRCEEDLNIYYTQVANAYVKIYKRLGLDVIAVRSDVGMMGGAEAHEYQYVSDVGEDHLVACRSCGYAANMETAEHTLDACTVSREQQSEIVYTPDCKDVASVARFFGKDVSSILKTLAFMSRGEIVLVSLRGDTELNLPRLDAILGDTEVRMATEEELNAAGLVPGYLSPEGCVSFRTYVDTIAYNEEALVAGANRAEHHKTGICPRDSTHAIVTNLSAPEAGSMCVACGGELFVTRGVEVGNIFKLGTKYSSAMHATYLDEKGQEADLIMGCYGIGVGRTIACIVEQHNDERGIIWPMSVAPYQVHLLAIGKQDEIKTQAEQVYTLLQKSGVEVLYDDREQTPGVKFGDADLLGMPLQVVVSKRSLEAGGLELRLRRDGSTKIVSLDALVGELTDLIASCP